MRTRRVSVRASSTHRPHTCPGHARQSDRPKAPIDLGRAFQMALAAVEDNVGYCESGNPGDPACLNTAAAWHNVEGASVFMGDVFAKAGRKTDALGFYQQAKTSETYAEWDFQALLDDRIATIDARITSFADTDVMNDALSSWSADNQCSLCHRQ